MVLLRDLRSELKQAANPAKAIILQRFFKTGKGEYGEGDKFLGIVVPVQRQIAKNYLELKFSDLEKLLESKFHEERLVALLILVLRYKKIAADQSKIYDFYLENSAGINNWDLVDLSAPWIVGHFLFDKGKSLLHDLVVDDNLWQRRVAIVATQYFIRNNYFTETFALAKKLLNDKQDLLHKATGWMLREVGNRDFKQLDSFLMKHYQKMPRTMLRYAIEKFPERRRLQYLHGEI